MKKIILASASPRREEILLKSGLKFETVGSDYEEDMNLKLRPLKLAKFLSRGKALSVAENFNNHIVIGADTFITLGDKLLGKPHTAAAAQKMLKSISAKTVRAISGFTIIDTGSGKTLSKAVETKVFIKRLTDKEISNYIRTKEPLDKAGAFAIQSLGAILVRKIEGDYLNVMGLPLFDLAKALKKFGIEIL